MSTPTAVVFSPIEAAPVSSFRAIAPILPELEIELEKVGKLGVDQDGEFGFLGEEKACGSAEDVISAAAAWPNFAVSCVAYPPNNRMYFYFWTDEERNYASIEVPATAVTFDSEQYEVGQWLTSLMLSAASATGAKLAAYGPPYGHEIFSSVSERDAVAAFRSGQLFDVRYPTIHLLSVDLIDPDEAKKLVEAYGGKPRQDYALTASGYHTLRIV